MHAMDTTTLNGSSEALPRFAKYYDSDGQLELDHGLARGITLTQAEYSYLLQQAREYNLLKNALFRGGLTRETLDIILTGEDGIGNETCSKFPLCDRVSFPSSATAKSTLQYSQRHNQLIPHDCHSQPNPDQSGPNKEQDRDTASREQSQSSDQRTLLITNLSDRTTHKDLAAVVRGGKLLDIHIRNDRSATISFVEGAADFLSHAKRNDIYLHTKRLEFSWNPRQIHVPEYISNKIRSGASRNLIVRGIAGRVTADEIREQLDHIHNLVVVDISFANGDALISTNSISNALFARTCMMSRTLYKGVKIDWAPDECAITLPASRQPKPRLPAARSKSLTPVKNHYAPLANNTATDSGSWEECMPNGARIEHSRANAIVT